MEPIPETLEAIGELDVYFDDGSLLEELQRQAAEARRIAPGLVGLSVAARTHGVTFTLVATGDEIAALDGVQYLSSGPCVEALTEERGLITDSADLLSEPRWHALSRASAAVGVASTLTFPVLDAGQVVGTVNLYGAADDTFDGKHQGLSAVFGGWAPGAVANADLSFSTRTLAQSAPARLREDAVVDTAVGIVAGSRGMDLIAAREDIEDAARRAGIPLAALARMIVEMGSV
jgi:GAF domain-containing protein